MANPQISTYDMTVENGKYTFEFADGYMLVKIEGTPKEIGYQMFQNYINTTQDGYGNRWPAGYDVYGPFSLEIAGQGPDYSFEITVDWLAAIRPEPPPEFWDELKGSFDRYLRLIAFS